MKLKIGVFSLMCGLVLVTVCIYYNRISPLVDITRVPHWAKHHVNNISYVHIPQRRTCQKYTWWSNKNSYTTTRKEFRFVQLNMLPGKETICGHNQSYPEVNTKLLGGLWYVTDTSQDIYVKSAYYDNRTKTAKVRLIGASPLVNARFYCQFYFKGGKVTAKWGYAVSDTWCPTQGKFKHRPHMYICDVHSREQPILVSLVSAACQYTRHWIIVKNNMSPLPKNKTGTIGLCLKTLFNMHSRESLDRLIEFVELNRLLGIQDIYIYGYQNVSTDVQKVLNMYHTTNQIHLISWTLPKPDIKVNQYLQLSAINDCLYNNMNNNEYIAVFDIDEFIIPEKEDLLQILTQKKSENENAGAFFFRNVYYNAKNYPMNDVDVKNRRYRHSIVMSHSLHQTESAPLTPPGKSVYSPKAVVYAGVHFPLTLLPGYELIFDYTSPIDTKLASVHHYRQCEKVHSKDSACGHPAHIRNRVAHRYKKKLLSRMKKIRQILKQQK